MEVNLNDEYSRICQRCNKIVVYSNKKSFRKALSKNSLCHSCSASINIKGHGNTVAPTEIEFWLRKGLSETAAKRKIKNIVAKSSEGRVMRALKKAKTEFIIGTEVNGRIVTSEPISSEMIQDEIKRHRGYYVELTCKICFYKKYVSISRIRKQRVGTCPKCFQKKDL